MHRDTKSIEAEIAQAISNKEAYDFVMHEVDKKSYQYGKYQALKHKYLKVK